ncbi:J domain-containing protein [Arthrobacter sp. Marseille-P9274]|uniref:J domain-containing protein n=1 Tax=Arthrobacter sp. Marseille-P9274 TaxID=2866572 RepID=UPI0021C74A42|nr:J domain-containing protein [Arthrobacter sp. Marseille-P9274]
MEEPDLYDILQVPSTAGPEDIRRAYRALLRKHHPDMHKPRDAVEARRLARNVAAIHHAYEVLSDPHRRAAYDRRSHRPQAVPEPRGRDIHVRVRVRRSGETRGPAGPSGSSPQTGPRRAAPLERDEVRVVREDPRQRQDDGWVVRDDPRQRQDEVWISPAWLRPRQDDAISLCPDESPLRPPPDVFERLLWRWFFP